MDQMIFLDCPAYVDEEGAIRCGLPAEVRCRLTMRSSSGPLEAAMIRCPSGHWFNGPIQSLTWESKHHHQPADASVASSAALDTMVGSAARHWPEQPEQDPCRPNTAPAYYLGRPAWLWINVMTPRSRRKPLVAAQTPVGGEHPPSSSVANARQPEASQARPR